MARFMVMVTLDNDSPDPVSGRLEMEGYDIEADSAEAALAKFHSEYEYPPWWRPGMKEEWEVSEVRDEEEE